MVTTNGINNYTPENFQVGTLSVNTNAQTGILLSKITVKGAGGSSDCYISVDANSSTAHTGYGFVNSGDSTYWSWYRENTSNVMKLDYQAVNKWKVDSSGNVTVANGLIIGSGSTLSSYVTGSWTPSISFGTGTTGITYSTQAGTYTRIGDLVHAYFYIVLTSKGSDTGNVRVNGLPYTVSSSNNAGALATSNITYTGTYIICQGAASQTYGNLQYCKSAAAGALITNSNFANNTQIQGSFIYKV